MAADGRPQVRFDRAGDPATARGRRRRTGRASLAAAAGVLALHSLEVHAAELEAYTAEGEEQFDTAVARFTVSPRFGGLPDPAAAARRS